MLIRRLINQYSYKQQFVQLAYIIPQKYHHLPASKAQKYHHHLTRTGMSMVTSVVRPHTALDEIDAKGEFKRTDAGYKHVIAPGSQYEPEAGRYHLYVSLACPWANGTLTALRYKGLEDIISVSVAHPVWRRTCVDETKSEDDTHVGWHFKSPGDAPVTNELGHGSYECDDACIPDTVNNCQTVRQLYEMANDDTGKYSTPVLWCKKTKTIVCNESLDILKMFDSVFDTNSLCKYPLRKLFPVNDSKKMAMTEELNSYIYPTVNNGVYRCGFARTQEAYTKAHTELFASLDKLEHHLASTTSSSSSSSSTFLTGEEFTWIDLRLYMTLVRFDPVYVVYFKTSAKRIMDYPNLLRYLRSCYAIPEVKATTNLRHIKMHYFASHPALNTYGIIPEYNGPELE